MTVALIAAIGAAVAGFVQSLALSAQNKHLRDLLDRQMRRGPVSHPVTVNVPSFDQIYEENKRLRRDIERLTRELGRAS